MHVSPKLKHAVMLGLLFFVVASPYTYKLVDRVVAPVFQAVIPSSAHVFKIAEGGCPTTYGTLVHGVVFALVAYYLHSH
jgi:hypothetical protein